MTTENNVLSEIGELFGDNSPQLAICRNIINHLRSTSLKNLQHLTFSRLRTIGQSNDDAELLTVLNFLSMGKFSILVQQYEFLDEEDDDYITIDKSELVTAYKKGYLYHPRNGSRIANFKDLVFVYYEALVGKDSIAFQDHMEGQ
ncbi:hypothetical protein [Chitinimonas lacunae]|uniref:Uncharacterized protein n=1 Tax=Chitinimonas lacunae TaxID=1963018 RepID=A0ABV8MJD5_9NEIS